MITIDYSGRRFSVYTLFPTEFYVADATVTNNSGSVELLMHIRPLAAVQKQV